MTQPADKTTMVVKTTRRWGPFRQRWYSICSKHMMHTRPDCPMCQTGQWINVWGRYLGGIVYKMHRPTWLWWANRPNGKTKKFLRSAFPNAKNDFDITGR